ncbi:MAG: hypothetical protein HUU15_11450 [Candidatus Brocadiae bacterium]|nr:hypothetical protein [Candidatus Brocadiia bacterium]
MTGTTWISTLSLASLLVGCAADGSSMPTGEPETLDIPSFEDYVDPKADTGYVGNRAAELEATLTGRVRVMLADKSAADLEQIAAALRTDPRSWEHRHITAAVSDQVKYARNALQSQRMQLNLEGGEPTFSAITVVEGGLELEYALRVESLVKMKDLERDNLTVADLVGRIVEARLPLVPAGLFDRAGATCATDPATGQPPSEMGPHNFFFYFDPAREGCVLADSELVTARYEVQSSLDAPTVYPEYDRLVADGRIEMGIIFGQIEHGELKTGDWGFLSFDTMTRELTSKGFRVTEQLPDRRGHRMTRTYPGGLVVNVAMYTPVDFADDVDRDVASTRFRDIMRASEVFYYNGHAFYGSLRVLDDPTAYPEGVYQVLFMDACWSYAYYTKQVFRNRATQTDVDGYALADVVNNTEPGITGSERTAAVLYDNLFKGAAAVHARGDASAYSWNAMIRYMNDHAIERARWRTSHPDPEIYGVSGVRTNLFQPGNRPPPPDPGTAGRRTRFASALLAAAARETASARDRFSALVLDAETAGDYALVERCDSAKERLK